MTSFKIRDNKKNVQCLLKQSLNALLKGVVGGGGGGETNVEAVSPGLKCTQGKMSLPYVFSPFLFYRFQIKNKALIALLLYKS